MDNFWINLVCSVVLTAVTYMFYPLMRLLIHKGKFEKKYAKRIALWNSIVLGAFFYFATLAITDNSTVWNATPAVVYYWINYSILIDKTNATLLNNAPGKKCPNCKSKLTDDSEYCRYCGSCVTDTTDTVDIECNYATTYVKKVELRQSEKASALNSNAKVKMWFAILGIVVAISLGGNVVQYLHYIDSTADMRKQLDHKNTIIENKDTAIATLKEKRTSLEETIDQLRRLINDNKVKASYLDEIVDEMRCGNSGYASSNFHASDSVIVVRKNDNNRKFTLTANWSQGGTVEVEYSSSAAWVSFDQEEWYTSTKMTVHPMLEGVTVVTFSNDVDAETFKVLIIVTS